MIIALLHNNLNWDKCKLTGEEREMQNHDEALS